MADIAKEAGVSKGAVWATLSKRVSNIGVAAETRKKIISVAERMDYRPDIAARGLTARKSYLVGLLCREAYEFFSLDLIRGLQDVLLEHEYSLVAYLHGDKVEDESRHLRFSLDRQVDGVVVIPALDMDGRTNAEQFAKSQERKVACVQVFNHLLPGIPHVGFDNEAAGRIATEHLLAQGHRRIVHFTHAHYRNSQLPVVFHLDARQRWQGYERAMIQAGLLPRVVTHDPVDCGGPEFIEVAKSAVDRLFEGAEANPTAVVAYNDYEATGLLCGLLERGISVPGEISVTGVDGLFLQSVGLPELTTLAWPVREVGRNAARMVLDQIEGKDVENILLAPNLKTFASSGPVPGA